MSVGLEGGDRCFSCVVDEHPRFHLDALRWYASLTEVAGVEPSDLVVHVVGPDASEVLDFLRAQGVLVRSVDPFDPRSPHCNKIAGALQLAEDHTDGLIVLCDTDTVILEDPAQLNLPLHAVGGKPVDAPVPPQSVIATIFAAAELSTPPSVPLCWQKDEVTAAGNFNGGFYLLPGPLLATVAPSWAHWAHWLLDRSELLSDWAIYVDQVAMALCIADQRIEPWAIDVRWNTPTHDLRNIPSDALPPAVIHYHQQVDRDGLIQPTGTASIDERIATANRAIRAVWDRASPDSTRRQLMARPTATTDSEAVTASRRSVVMTLMDALRPQSVLEVGCGDVGVTRGLAIPQYRAVDESPELIRMAQSIRPEGDFVVGTLAGPQSPSDLTLCFDLLTHQENARDYHDLVRRLWASTELSLLVSGYEARPADVDQYFHEPLSQTLARVAPDTELYRVMSEGPRSTYVLLKSPTDRHPRDFGPATLAQLAQRHPDPLKLLSLRLHARTTTGFFPDHAPRLWEYPVAAKLVSDHLPTGSRLVDVGAGVTPLTPYLTSLGYVVDTVDPSPIQRIWPPKPDWNEWDFLDYGSAGLANRSWNCALAELPMRPPFDGAYSISVIEHLPAVDRRALLRDIANRVRPGGLVVLTIDLVRGQDDLWNRNLGLEVESLAVHGRLSDVVAEGARVGLGLVTQDVVREWGDVHVDIGLLVMRRAQVPPGNQMVATGRRFVSKLVRSRR